MFVWRRIVGFLFVGILVISMGWGMRAAQAAVFSSEVSGQRLQPSGMDLTYPVLFGHKHAAADEKINADIYAYVVAQCQLAVQKKAHIRMNYIIHYENAQILSLQLTTYSYVSGTAHGEYMVHGVVYDKSDGERIPLTAALEPLSPAALQPMVMSGEARVFAADGAKRLLPERVPGYLLDTVPADYYLDMENGEPVAGLLLADAPHALGLLHILLPARFLTKDIRERMD
jgi:hypothetical protein